MNTMRIKINTDQHSFLFSHLTVGIQQIQPFRMRIQFQEAATISGFTNNTQHVNIIECTPLQQASCRMCQQREVRMLHGAQYPLGLFGARQIKAAMHRTNYHIELCQSAIRQIQATIFQNIHLNTLEQGNTLQLGIQLFNFIALLRQPQRIQTV